MKKKKQIGTKKAQQKSLSVNFDLFIIISTLLPLYFAGIFQGGYFPLEIYATLLLSLVPISLFLLKKVYKKEQLRKSGADLGLIAFLAATFISLFFTVYFHATLTEFYKVLIYIALFYILFDSIKDKKDIELLLNAILILGVILSILGIIAFAGIKTHAQGTFFVFLKNNGLVQGKRLSSTLQYANTFAAFLILQFFIAIGFLFKKENIIWKVIYGIFAILFLITMLFTQSRGGIIVFVIAIVIFLALAKENDRKWSFIGLAGIIGLSIIAVLIKKDIFLPIIRSFWNRIGILLAFLLGKQNASLGTRENMIKDSLKILREHPIFGTGNGTYQYVYMKYRSVYFFSKFPHSIFFQILDELGFVGATAFLYMLYTLIKKAILKIRKSYDIIDIALFSGLLGLLIHAFIDFDWSLMFIPLIFFVGFAILLQTKERDYFTFVCPIKKKEVETKKYTHKKHNSNTGRVVTVYITIIALLFLFLFPFVAAQADFNGKRSVGTAPWQKTVSMFNTATSTDPLCAEYHYDLAHYYSQNLIPVSPDPTDFVKKAESEYKAAIKHCPEFFLYHFELARLYLQTGNKNAISEFTKAVELNPIDAGGHAALGFAYLKLKKDTVMAKVQFEEALKLNPKNSDAYLGFGQLYEQTGDIDKAIENYKLAIKYNRKSAYAYYRLGMLYKAKNNLPAAVRNLFYAVQYNPSLQDAKTEFYKIAPEIIMIKPAGDESFKSGENLRIQWAVTNKQNAEYYNIYLVPKRGRQTLIKAGVPFNTHSYQWKIPKNIKSGEYKIRMYVVSHKIMQGKYGNWVEYIESKYFNIESK